MHQLQLYENNKPHLNHLSQSNLKNEFEKRIKGLSKFAISIIDKLELYLKIQVDRIDALKKFLGKNYDKHVPSQNSLTDCCYKIQEAKFGKNFNNTLGDFQELMTKYSFEKANNERSLFIFDIKQDQKDFVVIFSCKHFLDHAKLQASTGQPSFVCIDATFNLVRGKYKLLVVGNFIFYTNFLILFRN